MTTAEYRAHFSLWAILAAPLMAGNDLRDMKPEIREILTHKEVIAVDQDPKGGQGQRVRKNGSLEVWSRNCKMAAVRWFCSTGERRLARSARHGKIWVIPRT